jgi:NAD(P)-dependent dehydrogenase (short-subunit alcohol dehydrogenase family)
MSSKSYIEQTFNLDEKIIFLTGAAGHLVSEIACGLALAGAKVILGDVDQSGLKIQTDRIYNLGGEAYSVEIDVRDPSSVESALTSILEEHGNIHCILNGAGVGSLTPFFDIPVDEWRDMLDVLLTGTMLCCQVFGRHFVEKEFGCVVNISSLGVDPPLSHAYAYSAAKAAVSNLSKNLAREWGPSNVRVNILRPGFFPTERNKKLYLGVERSSSILAHTPMNRYGEPNELISTMIWLFSDSASFVTGAEILVDGGFSAMSI